MILERDLSRSELEQLIVEVKRLAQRYYALTGRPLGVTGEIAELEAVRLLGLELAKVRQVGWDAVRDSDGVRHRLQIKGRWLLNPKQRSGKLGKIDLLHEWDAVVLVLLDVDFDALAIFEASREAVEAARVKPGSKARNQRGQLSLSKFKSTGKRIWPAQS